MVFELDGSQTNQSNGALNIRQPSGIAVVNASGNDRLSSAQIALNVSIAEAVRCMSLYFVLCTKKHVLLQQIFSAYKNAPKTVKQAVQRQIPSLILTIRSSPELLYIISNPPEGSENLLMQVLQILTDGTSPPPDLISTVKRLYETKLKDAAVLIPILSLLTKDEVLPIFPKLVDLPLEKFRAALARILQIWRLPKLWAGFLKCAYQTKPHSFHVLLQLPAAQLENALVRTPALKVPLIAHASQSNIRSSLPRSTLVVLGLVQDAQPANSAPQIPPSADVGSSGQIATDTQASESAVVS